MAPTIIVGDDENAGDVARELLAAADNQRDVRVRTDLRSPAFEVPESLYKSHVGRRKRGDDEQRINAVEGELGDDAPPIEGDELPDSALVVEPGTGDLGGEIVGDELPESARVVEPPSNGDAPNSGDAGDQADEPEPAPKPRKRATSSRRATKSTPAAAGSGE
jgi:hypothetical protein